MIYIALPARGSDSAFCGCGCAPLDALAVAAGWPPVLPLLFEADAVPFAGIAGDVPSAGAVAAVAGVEGLADAVAAGVAKAPPTTPPRMIIGAGWCPDFAGIAATFSSVTAGIGSPSAIIDGVDAADSLAGSIAFTLINEGVEVETPSTTMDEACAAPFIAKRPIPNAPSKRIMRTPQPATTSSPHLRAGELKPACAET
ncbi:hypothetical protein [Mesorhizobium sp. WSM3224]|uniref:hypothetical protein n=1 Tax=Mesorhizobium sp. WSM3224 TaxID=1040986 RepID=UPI0012EC4F47|nr:hypothetical protein [Mesorhizobium sp. WSM3224]